MNIASVSTQAYARISSGSKINSASDNAAGLSITQGMDSQIKGMEQNVDNISAMSDLANTADGALEGIGESLGRIRELAVQASNGILTDSDKSIIQSEITQLMDGINSTSKNTEFNTIKLLDGSFSDKNTAMNPSGTGRQISIASGGLESLGIEGFDVTGSFDIATIDDALAKVSDSRSNLGSATNAFQHATNNTLNNIVNLTSAKSQIEDTDMATEISNIKRQQVLDQYSIFAQKAVQESQRTELGIVQNFQV